MGWHSLIWPDILVRWRLCAPLKTMEEIEDLYVRKIFKYIRISLLCGYINLLNKIVYLLRRMGV